MGVKCFTQEHNTMTPLRAQTWIARSGVSTLTIRPMRLSILVYVRMRFTILLSQMVDEGFDIKEKVQKLLSDSGYDKKRARKMDMDDFLG